MSCEDTSKYPFMIRDKGRGVLVADWYVHKAHPFNPQFALKTVALPYTNFSAELNLRYKDASSDTFQMTTANGRIVLPAVQTDYIKLFLTPTQAATFTETLYGDFKFFNASNALLELIHFTVRLL